MQVTPYTMPHKMKSLIVEHFSHKGLCKLYTKLFCKQLMKAFMTKTFYNQLLIDSTTYMLTINSPTLKSIYSNEPHDIKLLLFVSH